MLKSLTTLAAFVALGVVGCGSSAKTSQPLTPANKVVDVLRHQRLPATDSEVAAVQQHLTLLAHKCHESEEALALQTAASVAVLRERGLHGSLLELITALEKVVVYAETQPASNHSVEGCTVLLRALVSTLAEKN